MSARPRSADTKVRRLRAFMADGAWYAAAALAEVGGTRFAARLHEIRNGSDGERAIDYECRAVGGSDSMRLGYADPDAIDSAWARALAADFPKTATLPELLRNLAHFIGKAPHKAGGDWRSEVGDYAEAWGVAP